MPTYVFRCPDSCGDVEELFSMAAVPDDVPCPTCGSSARRTIAAPVLGVGNSAAMRAHDATRATADAPAVVSALPGRRGRGTPVTTNPLHRRLPRP
ncbi:MULTISPECIES: zinc ribbon domain-containing protein [unclassified Gordonia (in: high G+C Gram-positive bacteria)]